MRKLASLLVLMMLLSMVSMMNVSADTMIFGSNNAIKNGTASILVDKGAKSQQLIVAGYNGDTMTSASPVTIPAGSGKETIKFPALSKDTTSTRLFLWDNLSDMTPLMSAKTRDISQQDYYTITLTIDDIKNGGWGYSVANSSADRIGTNRAIPVLAGSILTYKLNGMKLCIDNIAHLAAGKDETIRKYWITTDGSYTVPNDSYLALTLATPKDDKITKDAFNTYKPEITIQIPYQTDIKIEKKDVESGGYRYGTPTSASDRIRVNRLIYLKAGSVVNYDVGQLQIHLANLENGEEANAYAQSSGWKTGKGSFTFSADGYLAVIIMIKDGTPITVDDYDEYGASISISEVPNMAIITPDDIEMGAWGHGVKMDDSANLRERMRVNRLIPVNLDGGVLSYNLPTGIEMYVRQVKAPTTSNSADNTVQAKGWLKGTGTIPAVTQSGYFAIAFKNTAASDTNFSEYTAQVAVFRGNDAPPTPPLDTTSTYPEGHRIIKKFGGSGNDWSFVYLPDDYYTNTSKTYPFVILNHGNGWNMDGSEQKANYSNITMYMPPTTENKANSRFICTEDSSLWYSNPTIEALLDAGYIVAGAQNYADGLYGNDNCRKACAAFYEYMVDTYRVQADNCFMVGASNGCMTTLNAANYLWNAKGIKIRGLILQYPLCGLKTHYLAGGHNDGIKSAYSIASGVTLNADNFYTYIPAEFDPVATNIEEQGYFPAIKIYYSNGDTTTRASANATPLINSLTSQGVTVDTQECTGNHGDLSHFDAAGFVTWFNSKLK